MATSVEREQRMYDALKRIARAYQNLEQLERSAEKQWGVSYKEALEMAYENIQQEAANAIRGMRRPTIRALKSK